MSTRTYIITVPQGSGAPVGLRRGAIVATPMKTVSIKPMVKHEPIIIHKAVMAIPKRPLSVESVEVEGHDMSHIPPRKRERLTHLSPDEKLKRRKMKNRMAAQSARDRKKAKMGDLEVTCHSLDGENEELSNENSKLKARLDELAAENIELRRQLAERPPAPAKSTLSVKEEPLSLSTLESAAFINAPQQKEQVELRTNLSPKDAGDILLDTADNIEDADLESILKELLCDSQNEDVWSSTHCNSLNTQQQQQEESSTSGLYSTTSIQVQSPQVPSGLLTLSPPAPMSRTETQPSPCGVVPASPSHSPVLDLGDIIDGPLTGKDSLLTSVEYPLSGDFKLDLEDADLSTFLNTTDLTWNDNVDFQLFANNSY